MRRYAIALLGFASSHRAIGYSILPQHRQSSHGHGHPRRATATTTRNNCCSPAPPPATDLDLDRETRRSFLTSALTRGLSIGGVLSTPPPRAAYAFDNRLDDRYADAPATTGTRPKDLGVLTRKSRTEGSYVGLKACGNSPNCLASSNPYADLPVRTISGWRGGKISDVKKVIDTYEVGHDDIDGGGYRVVEYDEGDGRYLYVEFQSYKAGYVDDFECWYNPKTEKFDVRSSSRVGYSDLGVNNLRLEYIAGRLEKEFGWTFERKGNGSLD